jgi:hypothetical protein
MNQRGLLEESLVVLINTEIEPLGFLGRHAIDCTYNVCQKSNRAPALITPHSAALRIEPLPKRSIPHRERVEQLGSDIGRDDLNLVWFRHRQFEVVGRVDRNPFARTCRRRD